MNVGRCFAENVNKDIFLNSLLPTSAFSLVFLKDSDLANTAGDHHLAEVSVGHAICPTHGASTGGAGAKRGAGRRDWNIDLFI